MQESSSKNQSADGSEERFTKITKRTEIVFHKVNLVIISCPTYTNIEMTHYISYLNVHHYKSFSII